MPTNYNEPWESDNGHTTNAEGGYVGYLEDFSTLEQERILACVNACAGVLPLVLEEVTKKGGFGKLPIHSLKALEELPDAD